MADLTTQGYANSINSTMLLGVLRLILNGQPQHGVLTHIEYCLSPLFFLGLYT